MIELLKAAVEIQCFMAEKGWKFCIIGGIATLRWGEPRFTQDIDITLLTEFGEEENYIHEVLRHFRARRPNMKEFAERNRVILIHSKERYPVDIALGGLPFEESSIQRSSMFKFEKGIHLRTCSAEDLIIYKAFADRSRDWLDVEGVVIRQNKLEWDYIWKQLAVLCDLKEDTQIIEKLKKIKQRFK